MDRIWIWFADNGNIRKWDLRGPFENGVEYVRAYEAHRSGAVSAPVSDLVARLRGDVEQLRRMVKNAAMGGDETGVRVKSPDLLLADLDEAAARISELEAALAVREEQVNAAREFAKRHPALTLIDLAEFEAFLKVPALLAGGKRDG